MLLPSGGNYNMPTNTDAIIAPKQRILIPNFIEGWVDAFDINMIPANGLYKAVNVIFDTLGSVETRKGLDPVLVTVPNTTRIRSFGWYEVAGSTPKLVCAYDNSIAYVKTSDWSTTDIITGLINTTGQIDLFSYGGNLYVLSGDDPMKVYNGTTSWDAGLTAPVNALTAAIRITAPKDALTSAAGASTGLTGTYKYAVTFVTASGESGIGPESSAVTVDNKDMALSNIPLGPTGVTSRKVYRTKANGILYYLLTTIADNTTKVILIAQQTLRSVQSLRIVQILMVNISIGYLSFMVQEERAALGRQAAQ